MNRFLSGIISVFTAAVMSFSAAVVPVSAASAATLPSNDAMLFVDKMGAGWNLGNAFDSTNCTWLSDKLDYESGWCGVKTTRDLIKTVKSAGYGTIRIPVSWHDHVDSRFNIDSAWLDRVKEVVDWSLDEGLCVILNVHHDVLDGYYYPSSGKLSKSTEYMKKIWNQLCDKFSGTGEKLIFEAINEPRLVGTNYEWYYDTNNVPADAKDSLDCINKLNQTFVDTVRASGGSNKSRYLLVGGYDTDGTVKGILSPLFKMPTDSAKNRLIADVHYYGRGEGKAHTLLDGLYKAFTSKGVPVVITEYGMNEGGFDYEGRTDIVVPEFKEFFSYARGRGVTVCVWDTNYGGAGVRDGSRFIDRASAKVVAPDVVKVMVEGGKSSGLKTTLPLPEGMEAESGSDKTDSSSVTNSAANTVKPQVTATAYKNKVKLKWNRIDGASKYRVYQLIDGKYTKVKAVSGTSATVTGLKSGKTYKFIVRAYVNGKWTEMKASDAVKVKTKS